MDKMSMSNLGGYEQITRMIKSVGGPKNAKRLTVAVGGVVFALGGITFAGGQKLYKIAKEQSQSKTVPYALAGKIFDITVDGKDVNGLKLIAGRQFRVLERDGDAVLIELIGDPDNPYIVWSRFLESVSNFPSDEA